MSSSPLLCDVLVCGAVCSRPSHPQALRTAGRPPLAVVLDRGDDVRFTRTALAAHDPAVGRIGVHPTVVPRSRLLWHDILTALGTPPTLPLATHAAGEAAERAVHTALQTAPPAG